MAEYFVTHYKSCEAKNKIQRGNTSNNQGSIHTPCNNIGTNPDPVLVNKMVLYVWMCDQYNLPKHRERALSILAEYATGLSVKTSPYYKAMLPASKIDILETLRRKFDGSCQLETGYSFPQIAARVSSIGPKFSFGLQAGTQTKK